MERKIKVEIYVDDDILLTAIAENEEVTIPILTTFAEIKNGGGIWTLYRHDKNFNIIEYHLDSDSLDTILNTIGY